MKRWHRLFNDLLGTCHKGALVIVNTIHGNRWSVYLPSIKIVFPDHLELSGDVLYFEEIHSIELPETTGFGAKKISNNIDLCHSLLSVIPDFVVTKGEIGQGPFSGECIYVKSTTA